MTAVEFGILLYRGDLGTLLAEFFQQLLADVGMRHLPAAEADGDLDAVAFFEEFLRTFQLDIEVVGVNARGTYELL